MGALQVDIDDENEEIGVWSTGYVVQWVWQQRGIPPPF